MDGAALIALTEEEFNQRAPQVRFFRIVICGFGYLRMKIEKLGYQTYVTI